MNLVCNPPSLTSVFMLPLWKRLTTGGSRLDRFLAWSAVAAVTCATVAAFLSEPWRQPLDYQPGDKFARVVGFDPSRSPATIAMFVRTNCGACEKAASTFRRIAEQPRSFQVVVIGHEAPENLKEFARRAGIAADALLSVPVGTIRFEAVPNLALIDQGGVVRSVWSGSQMITDLELDIVSAARALGGRGAR